MFRHPRHRTATWLPTLMVAALSAAAPSQTAGGIPYPDPVLFLEADLEPDSISFHVRGADAHSPVVLLAASGIMPIVVATGWTDAYGRWSLHLAAGTDALGDLRVFVEAVSVVLGEPVFSQPVEVARLPDREICVNVYLLEATRAYELELGVQVLSEGHELSAAGRDRAGGRLRLFFVLDLPAAGAPFTGFVTKEWAHAQFTAESSDEIEVWLAESRRGEPDQVLRFRRVRTVAIE